MMAIDAPWMQRRDEPMGQNAITYSTLSDIAHSIEVFDQDLIIYAVKKDDMWSPESSAAIVQLSEEWEPIDPPSEMSSLLPVPLGREVIEDCEAALGGRRLSANDRAEILIHYAVHDATPSFAHLRAMTGS